MKSDINKENTFIKRALNIIADVVFPESIYCICCGNIIDSTRSYSLCDHCMEHIRWNIDEPKDVDGMRVMRCVDYGIYERSIIFAFKYDGHRYIARDIARIMADRLRAASECDVEQSDINACSKESSGEYLVIPVPLHESKFFLRGFNQSALIGKYLAKEMNWRFADVLVRTKETKALRGLGPAERLATITGSIALSKEGIDLIRNQDIMLVDDFYTTGSTAKECGRALEIGRPRSISLIAFAGREWKNSSESL